MFRMSWFFSHRLLRVETSTFLNLTLVKVTIRRFTFISLEMLASIIYFTKTFKYLSVSNYQSTRENFGFCVQVHDTIIFRNFLDTEMKNQYRFWR